MKFAYKYWIMFVLSAFLMLQCEKDELGPNEIDGDTDLDMTKVGNSIGTYLYADGVYSEIADSNYITKNDNGIVTIHCNYTLTASDFAKIEESLGTTSIDAAVKWAYWEVFAQNINGTIDKSDTSNIKVNFDIMGKVTSEGIQDFIHSGNTSKPYTIVKFDDGPGAQYKFTDSKGKKFTRTIISKSTDNDYSYGFYNIKVAVIEEVSDDTLVDKITYVTNHKFGLVGIRIKFKTGKEFKIGCMNSGV